MSSEVVDCPRCGTRNKLPCSPGNPYPCQNCGVVIHPPNKAWNARDAYNGMRLKVRLWRLVEPR